ncbi:MAG: hypothetical protein H6821_01015 [Planctomycetaceae bacterium]|nr:hypothetical protein [Planctomycetales bacterium]MCB9872731.1 hypothetical protein [Planctomycetaceae bacterium]MCB9926217.1 hypothetical protein [Planctomycetaceae bacterium]
MSELKKKTLRDFIYLDIERLYSIYSQVFEGVVDQIIKSYESSLATDDSQKGPAGSQNDSSVFELSRRTENRFLYDHMYERLEGRVASTMLDVSAIDDSADLTAVRDAGLIKVRGNAEIEDYERFKMFMENFNKIGEAIAYAAVTTVANPQAAKDKWQEMKTIKNKDERKRAEAEYRKLSDTTGLAKETAKQIGLQQDETSLANLRFFTELFYQSGFDVTVTPSGGSFPSYRGQVEKRWLRLQPDRLRWLFGGYTDSNWTMVGHVTCIPSLIEWPTADETSVTPPVEASTAAELLTAQLEADASETPSLRDPFRQMFRAAGLFERMFMDSEERTEVIVCPLAIYREIEMSH